MAKNNTYYINKRALTFTPNYQGLRDVVYVSIVSGAAISVMVPGVPELGFDVNADYQRWSLTATTTKLGTTGAYFIYARLQRSVKKAMIIFSVNDYNVDGSVGQGESATEESADYWYIKIGSITASKTSGGTDVDRVLEYDSGMLGTPQGNTENNAALDEMFEFNSSDKTIKVKHPLVNLIANGLAKFNGIVEFAKGIKIFGKSIESFIGTPENKTEADTLAESEDTLVTPKFVKAYGDLSYVSKVNDDSVEGNIAFKKDISVAGNTTTNTLDVREDATIGGNQTINGTQEVKGVQTLHQGFKTPDFFQQGDIIQGAQVDADGNAAFTSITAPVMQIYELQYNRKTAVQEEFIFSDGDTIETVTYIQSDGTEIDSTVYNGEEYSYIRLGVRKQYEGYMTTFKDEDILYSNVNIIGESGQPATTGKCWMRVLALNNDLGVDPISSDGLFINALLYSTSQCPAGVNMAPTPHMIISRHGNAGIDEDGKAKYPERQSVFIISTASENMVMLRGISAPIIPQTGAYAIVSGKLPQSLFDKVHSYASYISKDDPVSYARYGIFENMIQLDHEGLPIKTERYRGVWSEDIAKGDEDNRYRSKYATDITYYDTVSYEGSKWACEDDKTEEAPSDSSTKWTKIVSKGDDGTSIKVSGSYNTVEAFNAEWKNADGTWKAPTDESMCYVVAGDLYVWVQNDAKWDNVGRFKGDKGDKGDSVTGSTIQYAVNQSMTTKPNENEFSDRYPTTINEGDVLWTRTMVNFDNAAIKTEWAYSASRQGKNGLDNSSVTFELQPNVTTIYIHDEDNLSTESINLTVRKTTSKGVEIIDNNADLLADGFKLQYTYDGILDDRKDIVLNPETILLEDGSEMLLEDDSAAELEFTVEDILNVKNYIEFYLVKTGTNEIWATCTVAVVHDGESTLSVELSIKDITVNVNVETEPWEVLDPTTEYQVNVQVKKGGVAQDLSKYTLSNRSNTDVSSSKDTFGFITIDAYTKAVILPIANGMPFSYLPKWVEFTAVNKSHTNRKASDKLYIKSSQRGWTGPMGNDGASYYPQGEWDANTEYVATKNSDGVVIARPIVYHDPLKNGNGTYYVLEADKSIDDDPAEFSPSVWRAFQSFEYLFTKVLMAQWAQLADAVFHGSYMFSSYGVDANGNRNIYSNFQDSKHNMFDSVVINGKSTYRLNGKFTPNIFLDLLNGGAKFNCLSEPFVQMNPSTSLYKIDPSIAHNVSVQYGREDKPAMIFMPESDSLTDGVNCTVVYQSISMTGEVHEMDGVEWGGNLGNKLVILCADGRMRNTSYETDRSEGFFMVNGIPTRMLFIASGDVVKLKSVEIANKKQVWVVENQSDFSIMKSDFYFKKNDGDVADLFNVECNNVGWYPQGMDSSFASARIMAKAPDNTTPLNYNVYLEDGYLEAY